MSCCCVCDRERREQALIRPPSSRTDCSKPITNCCSKSFPSTYLRNPHLLVLIVNYTYTTPCDSSIVPVPIRSPRRDRCSLLYLSHSCPIRNSRQLTYRPLLDNRLLRPAPSQQIAKNASLIRYARAHAPHVQEGVQGCVGLLGGE